MKNIFKTFFIFLLVPGLVYILFAFFYFMGTGEFMGTISGDGVLPFILVTILSYIVTFIYLEHQTDYYS